MMPTKIKKVCIVLLLAQLSTHVLAVRLKPEASAGLEAGAKSCSRDIYGAVAQNSQAYPQCKCNHHESVFCGYSFVGLRKFSVTKVKEHPECQGNVPYCAKEAQRPALATILRENPCQDWSLFSVTNLLATPSWFNYDMRATAIVTPGELKYKSEAMEGKGSGNPELHFLIPSDAKTVRVIVYNIGVTSGGKDFEVAFKLEEGKGGPMTITSNSGGGVSAELFTSDRLEWKLGELNNRGIYLKDPFHFMFDEPESLSDRTKAFSFYKKWMAYRKSGFADEEIPSTGMWQRLDNGCFDDCRLAPIGPNETKVIGYAYAVRAMQQMGPKLQCHNLFRRNEFGVNVLNGYWWPEKPNHAIGLADNLIDHALNRKWIDRLAGPALANSEETMNFIRRLATDYWKVKPRDPDVRPRVDIGRPTEQKKWTTLVLHKLLAFVDISDEDADTFLEHKENVVVAMMLPEWVGHRMGGGEAALKWKAGRIEAYKKSLADKFGDDFTALSPLEQTKLTSGVLDALMFAGGVSVPTVIKSCFAILFGKYGQEQIKKQFGENWHLDEKQLDAFVHETIRRFPAVGGFLAWDRATNSKTNVDLRGSNADQSEDGWGPHARDFWMRDIAEYEKKSISWGDFAMVNGDNAHPGSRACPAKRLSFVMIREFLRAFLQSGGPRCWRPKDPEKVKISGQGGAEFELAFQEECFQTGS